MTAGAISLEREGFRTRHQEHVAAEAIRQEEYGQLFGATAEAILTTYTPVMDALDADRLTADTRELATQAARSAALSIVTAEKSEVLKRTLGLPEYTDSFPQAVAADPDLRGAFIVWRDEVHKFAERVSQDMQQSRPDFDPGLVIERASDAVHTLCGDIPEGRRIIIDRQKKRAVSQPVVLLDQKESEQLRTGTAEILSAVAAQRFTRACQLDPALNREVSALLRPVLDEPGTFSNRVARLAELIEGKFLIRQDAGIVVSGRFDRAVAETPGIDAFRREFNRGTLRDQVDVVTWALDGFSRDTAEFAERYKKTEQSASRLASNMNVSPNTLKQIIGSAWEHAASNLFHSSRDEDMYNNLSVRERATVLTLMLNNGLSTKEKVRLILEEPGSHEVIREVLASSDNGSRFSGWFEASYVAAFAANTAVKAADARVRDVRHQTPAGEPGGRPPEPPDHHTVRNVVFLTAITALLAACSGMGTAPATVKPAEKPSPAPDHAVTPVAPVVTFTPEATAVLAATQIPSLVPTNTVVGSPDSTFLAASGLPAGSGGAGQLEALTNTVKIQDSINEAGWAIVYHHDDPSNSNILSWTDSSGICWFNSPQHMFDPNKNPETLTGFDKAIAHFAPDTKGGVPLDAYTKVDISDMPAGYACLGAIMNNPKDPNYTAYEVLLYNTSTFEVIGWMPAVFAKGEKLSFVASADGHFGIRAGSEMLHWMGVGSTELMRLPTEAVPTVEISAPPANVPDYYPGLAPSLDAFPLVDKSDIPKIIAYLHTQPSLLTDGDKPEPVQISPAQWNNVGITCNTDKINCAVAASVKISVQGQDEELVILEMRNTDESHSRVYVTGALADYRIRDVFFQRLLANPKGPRVYGLMCALGANQKEEVKAEAYWPLRGYLMNSQPGYQDLFTQVLKTNSLPPEIENFIIVLDVLPA